jgi:sugar lactone lactonase YvrE
MNQPRTLFWLLVSSPLLAVATGTNFQISAFNPNGQICWTNAFPSGVCTLETASQLNGINGRTTWVPQQNYFTTNSAGAGGFPLPSTHGFFRLLALNISTNAPQAYTNLLQSYGQIHTIAGNGDAGYASPGQDVTNYWQPGFEGGYATNAALSRPHFAMADGSGNVFIVDKNSDSVLKVTLDGRIHTVAGTHAIGNGPDTATSATAVAMNMPNGLWVRGDGTVYVLDTGNGKVRRLDTNGMLTTLFTDSKGISGGRGLWVKDDESLVYYASGSHLRQWTPGGGSANLNSQFNNLGNLIPNGTNLVATDRDDNTVWLVATNNGARTLLFGNGGTNPVVDGTFAATNALYGVRGVWQPPISGYFLATDYGAQLLYVDVAGVIHILVNGKNDDHAGDGQWFYSPANHYFGELRSVSMDYQGNLIIVENDTGYVRRIDFQRLTP